MFVRAVVIDDQMHMEPLRHAGIEVAQKAQELLMAMAGFALSDDPTIGDVERGKRSGRPMPLVVVADAFHVAQAKGQDGLGAFQGLRLALIIHREGARHRGALPQSPGQGLGAVRRKNGSVASLKLLRRCGFTPNRAK